MRILATSFLIAEREDVEFTLADTIAEFEKTERGQWLMANSYRQLECSSPVTDPSTFAYKVVVWAWLTEADLTFYTLKWK